MFRPKITIYKKEVVLQEAKIYVKISQRDYILSFKINIEKEIESKEFKITDSVLNTQVNQEVPL